MIDALGDVIDVKKSLQEDNLVSFIHEKLPFWIRLICSWLFCWIIKFSTELFVVK